MERLELKFKDATRAVETLDEILKMPFSIVVRDATIQRFEYTFEAVWKFLSEYLKEREGKIVHSPKACFREIFSSGFLTEEETIKFLEMTDKRNETSHTYKEEVAGIVYGEIKAYFLLMKSLMEKFDVSL
mgnify:CR=1 FL=1